jgi:hypothetical protein
MTGNNWVKNYYTKGMNGFYRFLERHEIPKKRVLAHLLVSVLSGGIWVIFAFAIEVFIASERRNKIVVANRSHEKTRSDIVTKIEDNKDVLTQIETVKEKTIATIESRFEIPFEISDVKLWESREKITTVTSGTTIGKTRAGTVGFGWNDGIGLAATEGVTRGTFTSGTTEMTENEFTQLDSGTLRIGKDFTAFIGDQFTRTAKYSEILSYNNSFTHSIGFNVLNSERAWLARFRGEYESKLILEIFNVAYNFSKDGNILDITSLINDFDAEIMSLKEEISKLVADLEEIDQSKPMNN